MGGTLVSRTLGFIRELVVARYFGAGSRADAFFAALTIPTLFRDVLGEDVVERSFMPGIREFIARRDYESAWRLASAAVNWMLVGMALVMAFVYLAAPWLVTVVAKGFDDPSKGPELMATTIALTRVLTPFIMFIALAAFAGGLLYYIFDRHLAFSFAPAMLSVGVISGLVFFFDTLGIYSLAVGFVAGGALQFLVQIPSVVRGGRSYSLRYRLTLRPPENTGGRMTRETAYVTLQSILTKTTEVFDRRVASFLAGAGSISSLWYAVRLVQLPLAIFTIAVSRAITPYLSEQIGKGDRAEFRSGLLSGFRYNLLFIMPATGLMIALAEPIVRVIFERGSFGATATTMTASALWCYAVGLLGMSLVRFGSTVCSTLERNKVPMYTAVVGGVVNIWLNYVLSATYLKHAGLAMATSIGFTVNAILLFGWLHRHLKREGGGERTVTESGGFTFRELFAPAFRVGVNALASSAVAYLVFHHVVIPMELRSLGFIGDVIELLIPLAVGGIVYIIASLVNPVEEVQPLLRRIRRYTGRD
jgi:putative peptidoglycan lipid II flippase